MEITYSALKCKDVINLTDGKNLGKVCDLTFHFPENHIVGITVTGSKGFKFSKQEVFIPMRNVVQIGQDAVLVRLGGEGEKCPPNGDRPPIPPECPPPRPNCPPPRLCPPECPPQRPNCPPHGRRSYDEYE